MTGPSQFGVFLTSSFSTVYGVETQFMMGTNSKFTQTYAITIRERRPLTETCRAVSLELCSDQEPRMACENCIEGLNSPARDQMIDAGCDMDQTSTLTNLNCMAPTPHPSASCVDATSALCNSTVSDGWLNCYNCMLENGPQSECSNSTALQIMYAVCVDGQTQN